jgi:hypothetical protein
MTMQFRDTLLYNDAVYDTDAELLEPFLDDKGIKSEHSGSFSANWRGYIAHFEIKDFEIHIINPKNSDFFEKVIRELGTTKLIYLNRLVILYTGHVGDNYSLQCLNTYKNYQVLEIRNGNLTDFKILDHTEFTDFKKSQFLKFIETDDYQITKLKRMEQLDTENSILREQKGKGPGWHKYKFRENEFLEETEKHILHHTKIFY